MLENENHNLKMKIIISLGETGDRQAVEPLCQVLENNDSLGIQCEAVKALGKISDPAAVENLVMILETGEPYCKRRAAEALGKIGDNSVLNELFRVLGKSIPSFGNGYYSHTGLANEMRDGSFRAYIKGLIA